MKYRSVRSAAVLGAGIMGSQIAAHLANAGVAVQLLDIVPEGATSRTERNRLATSAINGLTRMKPAPLMSTGVIDLIAPGNLEDNFDAIAGVDLVIESVVERMDVKQPLWERIGTEASPGTVLGTGTSGLSCTALSQALPAEHRRNFLGIHFFNPPRHMNLIELVLTQDTDPAVVEFVTRFAEQALGKSVVISNDTPNFIANRVGTYSLMTTLAAMDELGLSIDAVDAITGPAMGRPRSATFRTLDLVGLDTMAHVASNTRQATTDPAEAAVMELPGYIDDMLERGWLGEKAGQGFYKRIRGDGGSTILALDLGTMEYVPREETRFQSLDDAARIADPGERIRTLVNADDPAAQLAWQTLSRTLAFTASKADEIANGDVNAIDRAMRAGFNWEIGPFEIWNAIGVQESISRMEANRLQLPDWVKNVESFPVDRTLDSPLSFEFIKRDSSNIVKQTTSTTLVDLGDDVLGLEFHAPHQALDQDYFEASLAAAEETIRNWRGLVISASASNFCVGANLAMVLGAASDSRWDEIDRLVRQFQESNMRFKFLERPVVVAPAGMALGGGAEIVMHGDRAVAAAETYLGLVEIGVGLLPAGGGLKEMVIRAASQMPAMSGQMPNRPELINFLTNPFETIGTAKVSGSAAEAVELGFLRGTDRIVMNRLHVLNEAKREVTELDVAGYIPPQPATAPVAGPDGRAVLDLVAYSFHKWGLASKHDYAIVRKLAYVLTGGELPGGTTVPEQYLLDLEREAFLELCGMEKTRARMAHMLKTGKPLRN